MTTRINKKNHRPSNESSTVAGRNAWWLKLPKRLRIIICGSLILIVLTMGLSALALYSVSNNGATAAPLVRAQPAYNIADVLSSRPASTLVAGQGILKLLHPTLGNKRQTFVLNSCPAVNDAVIQQLQNRSIAVLVSIRQNPGKSQCTLAQIVQAYGRPNASSTLTGSLTNPKEVLLFYDYGPQQSGPLRPVSPVQAPATVVPITLATLPAPTCPGKTHLSIVAHEDDDLLFMNPDLLHTLHTGGCLRTVYLTAGDDGFRSTYWLGREKGVEAAYDTMIGHGASLWIERYVSVNSHEYIKMASPRGNSSITLAFVNLPDGNVPGTGFSSQQYQSLAKLMGGSITAMHTVDGQSQYSKNDLITMLVKLMQFYHPNEIDTQTPLNASTIGQEHSDHMTAGQFAAAAYALYAQNASIKYYTGYPISQLQQNVSGQDLTDKTSAFYAYVPHDSRVCLNPADCGPSGPYASWLMRQYTYAPGDPLISSTPTPTTTSPVPTDPSADSTTPAPTN